MILFSTHISTTEDKPVDLVLLDAGQRGMVCAHEKGCRITAIAEKKPVKREIARREVTVNDTLQGGGALTGGGSECHG